MIARLLQYGVVSAIVYFVVPIAFHYDPTVVQALAIAWLAFVAKDLFVVEPEIYVVNGIKDGEDAE